ncbi:MAG: hypothetical protein LBI87_10815 [Candidatus Accumulibacter sp.]|jgi:hypothetical protein|nr:hypothetical protein [Accumulibacter sp.]
MNISREFLAGTSFCIALLVSGCMNMPTPPSQITGAYISHLRYEGIECSRLSAELSSLSRRENQLVSAQEQRIKTSETQAFWYGHGQGDGIEASELATVRGEREAIRRAMEIKSCETSAASRPSSSVAPATAQ